MAKVNMTADLNVALEDVWKLIGGFNALPDWHPAVEKSKLEKGGRMRKLSLVGGGTIIEKLEKVDEGEHLYTYSIVDSPLPVANYTATIRVKDAGGGKTKVEWSSEFDAEGASENEAVKAIQGIYQAGFDNLKKIFGN
ncbi:MAG: Polyketide cyclase / dehydrase and lipid transport [Gammaproteobacteria bacterium]|nr:Polyketide cyclase / dehydrase and lipid transport [Gammaproteobacteria bacterium]